MLNNLNHLEIIEGLERGSFRRQRIFRDRTDPFDELDDIEFRKRYWFSKNTTKYILREIENDEDLCRLTRTNQSLPSHFQLLLALRYYAMGRSPTQGASNLGKRGWSKFWPIFAYRSGAVKFHQTFKSFQHTT